MDKYYKEKTFEESRTKKNKDIYNKHMEDAFEDLSLTSNISVIDTDIENLDLEKLKEYLDERYKKDEKPKIDPIDDIEETVEDELIDTKEYDLKRIIEEAHKNKETNYDRDRFKKLRDTQYDILKNLNIDKNGEFDVKTIEENTPDSDEEENGLLDLIADGDTEVMAPVEEKPKEETTEEKKDDDAKDTKEEEKEDNLEVKSEDDEPNDESTKVVEEDEIKPSLNDEIEKTLKLSKKQIEDAEVEEEATKEEELSNTENNLLNNTFYTGKYQIKESDLDGFDDLKKELKTGNMLTKILIGLLVLIVLAVIFFFVDKYLHLGFFTK